jgi:glutamine synthetase
MSAEPKIDDIKRVCKEQAIHTIECCFPDPLGTPRGKRIPVRQFVETAHRGIEMASVALAWDRRCDILQDISSVNFSTGYPDMHVVPDLSTFRPIPWRPGAASVVCDCREKDGRPVAFSTRSILRSTLEEAHALGFEPLIGSELEFYLLDGDGKPLYSMVDCYSLTRGAQLEGVLGRIRRELDDFGIVIEASNTEYGPGQVEVNIRYGPALETADNTMLFKAAIKEIANQEGCQATFMAKPFALESGSGYHVHMSLAELDGAEFTGNAFAAAEAAGVEQCAVMRAVLGGLLTHAPALTALGCPTVNAFKRVQGYTFAPTNVCWGIDNRTVTVRAIVGHGAGNRLEWRSSAADCNPYVLISGCIAAAMDGIREDRAIPPRVEGDAYSRQDLPLLPETLEDALAVLDSTDFGLKMPGEFLEVFVALGRREIALWRAAVTDWERDRYLEG